MCVCVCVCVCVFLPFVFFFQTHIQGLLCSCETEITYFQMLGLLVHSQPCPGEDTEPELGQGVQRELLRVEGPSPQHRQTNRCTKFSSDQAGPLLPSTGFSEPRAPRKGVTPSLPGRGRMSFLSEDLSPQSGLPGETPSPCLYQAPGG